MGVGAITPFLLSLIPSELFKIAIDLTICFQSTTGQTSAPSISTALYISSINYRPNEATNKTVIGSVLLIPIYSNENLPSMATMQLQSHI